MVQRMSDRNMTILSLWMDQQQIYHKSQLESNCTINYASGIVAKNTILNSSTCCKPHTTH